jgi:hypothetical protein
MSEIDRKLILKRLQSHYGFKKNKEFADFLGISPQILSNWKARNAYDATLLYTKCVGINPELLLTGKGELFKKEIPINNEKSVYGGIGSFHIEEGSEVKIKEYTSHISNEEAGEINSNFEKKIKELEAIVDNKNLLIQKLEKKIDDKDIEISRMISILYGQKKSPE